MVIIIVRIFLNALFRATLSSCHWLTLLVCQFSTYPQTAYKHQNVKPFFPFISSLLLSPLTYTIYKWHLKKWGNGNIFQIDMYRNKNKRQMYTPIKLTKVNKQAYLYHCIYIGTWPSSSCLRTFPISFLYKYSGYLSKCMVQYAILLTSDTNVTEFSSSLKQ